nr:MAG TPA: hypothetical protein [Caudoviricetes sp.]
MQDHRTGVEGMSDKVINEDYAISYLQDVQDWLASELSDPDSEYREKLAKAIILVGDAIDIIVDYEERDK